MDILYISRSMTPCKSPHSKVPRKKWQISNSDTKWDCKSHCTKIYKLSPNINTQKSTRSLFLSHCIFPNDSTLCIFGRGVKWNMTSTTTSIYRAIYRAIYCPVTRRGIHRNCLLHRVLWRRCKHILHRRRTHQVLQCIVTEYIFQTLCARTSRMVIRYRHRRGIVLRHRQIGQ